MFNWNDLRYFRSVMREGNTLAASRVLHVSQTTIARRIEALEAAIGLELFDKRRTGYVPTEAARALADAAGGAEAAVLGFASLAEQMRRGVAGTVRLTTSQIMADMLLTPALGRFHDLHPGLKLEVVAEDRFLDLAKGEADIALRVVIARKDQPGLVGRRLCGDRFSVYCSRFRNNVAGMFSGIKAGYGVSVMSDLLAACDEDFVRCFTPDIEQPHEVWLLTHERLRDVPRVRTVLDFLAAYFAEHPAVRQVSA